MLQKFWVTFCQENPTGGEDITRRQNAHKHIRVKCSEVSFNVISQRN